MSSYQLEITLEKDKKPVVIELTFTSRNKLVISGAYSDEFEHFSARLVQTFVPETPLKTFVLASPPKLKRKAYARRRLYISSDSESEESEETRIEWSD